MSEAVRIDRELLMASIFAPKPRDFGKTMLFIVMGVALALVTEITLVSDRKLSMEFSFLLNFVGAVSVFVILEAWVIASYEQLLMPLKIVEIEQRLVAGEFERVNVAPLSKFHLWTNQYWQRTTSAKVAGAKARQAVCGRRDAGAFEGLLFEVARRPFLFKKWVVVPAEVLGS